MICLQECSVSWAAIITSDMGNDIWRVQTYESLLIAWRSDSLDRIDNEWQLLFPKDSSANKKWRGYMRVRLGFLGWSTAASPVREFQSSGTRPARKADVDRIAFHTDCLPTSIRFGGRGSI